MERSPHRLFVFDTETDTEAGARRQVLPLKLWCAETVQRHGRRPRQPAITPHQGRTGPQLVDALERSCRSSETTWAFAHNLSFDLGATRLPLLLRERGWVITAHALATDSPWARLSRGSHRLVLADSASYLPAPLAAIGVAVEIEKPPLPAPEDAVESWWWRCRQDVAILRQALVELMDWWDNERLGSWSITGPQTGFNALRHRPTPHTVVIDPDAGARTFERRAISGGRRECWRVGQLPAGDYREIDFERAHATIAAHCALPKRRSVRFCRLDLDDWRLTSDRWAPIAECVVRARTPRYPLQVQGRLFYPVGTFRTVLAGPELREALQLGELLEVGPGYVYQLGQHMAGWGRWVLQQLAGEEDATPAVALTAIKGWSRTVPGKWAARTGSLHRSGPSGEMGWHLEVGRHHPSGAPVAVLDMGGRREIILQDQDADDCFPAVLAWIQSEVRVRLGRLIDAIGPDHMVSCNTDGLLCSGPGLQSWEERSVRFWPLRAREKARYRQLEVLSPQHVIHDGQRRLSGVPAGAEEVAPHQYRWWSWPRLGSQIASSEPRGYVRDLRTADLSAVPVNRWVWSDGLCTPVEAQMDDLGDTHLMGDRPDLDGARSGALRTSQHPVLQQLLAPAGAYFD